ncbi:uncharacterized protein LOC106067170 isoform X1 [Biomphalaria glabrata]|uniref:Uncharacterized protein LOC106067170 isoform X1 n=1 Tax=Biomphalaria glabrata TaxID=6526 RepID=A0A9W3AH61_BIOGL|nr:uncharacterized protein LOC106067170 isoform X1 [Biomphalaria glabrata]
MNQKLDLKVYTIIICAASFVSSLFACNVTNRFGEDCVYNCHCKLNTLCTENGGCPEGCQEGWFGPECQYKDMVASNDNQYMRNESDGCLVTPEKDGTLFTLFWHSSFNFTWMRLIFKEPGVQRNVTLTFSSQGSALSWHNCAVTIIGNQTYNIDCDNLLMVDTLAIKTGNEKSLCNVFVSGGREEPVELTSQTVTIWTSPSLNMPDWEMRMDSKNCTQKIPASSGQHNRTVLLNRYMFLDLKPFTKVRLLNYSADSLEVFVYEDAGQPAFMYFTPENVTSLVSIREISGLVRVTGRIISLCQVENYEDSLCIERKKYAIHCNQPTHCMNESDVCILYFRLCRSGCSDGFTGECCTSYCPFGTYGKNCSLKCDDKCTQKQGCHPVNGNCVEPCPMSINGDTCQTETQRFQVSLYDF